LPSGGWMGSAIAGGRHRSSIQLRSSGLIALTMLNRRLPNEPGCPINDIGAQQDVANQQLMS